MNLPLPPIPTHCARDIIGCIPETLYGDLTTYVTGTVEDGGNISAYKAGNLTYKAGIVEKLDRKWEAKIDQHIL